MKILIVDDEEIIAFLVQEIIETEFPSIELTVCYDGQAAWQAAREKDFDLVITDHNLPHIQGLDLIKNLHGSPRPAPAACLVTADMPDEIHKFKYKGRLFTLTKPFVDEDIIQLVKQCTQKAA